MSNLSPFYEPDDPSRETVPETVSGQPVRPKAGNSTKSTAAPPVGQPQPVPTTAPAPVPAIAETPGIANGGLGGMMRVYHQLGLDKDYLGEAAKLLPPPPPTGQMSRQGWAALLIPAMGAALGGGPLGMAAAGKAIGTAGLQQAQNRQTDWQNRYRYATGLGTLANQMASQGRGLFNAIAPYYGMHAYDQARIAEEEATRVQRAQEFAVSSGQRQQEIVQRADAIAGQQQSAAERNAISAASLHERQAYDAERVAISQGNSALAAKKDQEAQYWHGVSTNLQGKRVDAAIAAWKSAATARDRGQKLSALRTLRAALQDELTTEMMSTDTPDPGALQSIRDQIASVDTALNQAAGSPEDTGGGPGVGTPTPGTSGAGAAPPGATGRANGILGQWEQKHTKVAAKWWDQLTPAERQYLTEQGVQHE